MSALRSFMPQPGGQTVLPLSPGGWPSGFSWAASPEEAWGQRMPMSPTEVSRGSWQWPSPCTALLEPEPQGGTSQTAERSPMWPCPGIAPFWLPFCPSVLHQSRMAGGMVLSPDAALGCGQLCLPAPQWALVCLLSGPRGNCSCGRPTASSVATLRCPVSPLPALGGQLLPLIVLRALQPEVPQGLPHHGTIS